MRPVNLHAIGADSEVTPRDATAPETTWRQAMVPWRGAVDNDAVPFRIDQTALILIDLQRAWTEPKGPVGTLLAEQAPETFDYFYHRLEHIVIPCLMKVLERYRAAGLPVVHVTFGAASPDGRDLSPRELRRRHPLRGSINVGDEWHRITEELMPLGNEFVLNKTGWSPFNSTGVDQLLRNLGIDEIAVAGLLTDGCVSLTARDAADRGYETFLVEDGCATYTEDGHERTLLHFQSVCGPVLTHEDVLRQARTRPEA